MNRYSEVTDKISLCIEILIQDRTEAYGQPNAIILLSLLFPAV